jgi:hypothetical protein
MGADGALRADVLAAFQAKGCTLDKQADGSIRIGWKDVIQVHHFGDTVSRSKLDQLCRSYGLSMGDFFPRLS